MARRTLFAATSHCGTRRVALLCTRSGRSIDGALTPRCGSRRRRSSQPYVETMGLSKVPRGIRSELRPSSIAELDPDAQEALIARTGMTDVAHDERLIQRIL